MTTNPLFSFGQLPNFSALSPAQVEDAVDSALAAAEGNIARATGAGAAADWDGVMAPIEAACETIERVWNQVEHIQSVMSSEEWRAAHQKNLAKVAAFYAGLGQNAAVYQRVLALANAPEFAALSAARQKVVKDSIQGFELSGVQLQGEAKERFRANSERLAALAAQFEERLLMATQSFYLTAAEDDLGDMPADLRAIAAETAKQKNETGFCFTLQQPSYIAFMKYGGNRALREKLYRAYVTRASDLGDAAQNNLPIMGEILRRRQEQAALLGFDGYADMALQNRMAPSVPAVTDFLRRLIAQVKPSAEREMAELKEFAARELGIGDLQVWDVTYAAEKLRRMRFDFSDADLRPYLSEEKIVQGLFDCLHKLFGVSLSPAESNGGVWHEDARLMALKNAGGEVIGYVYLDLYARDNKRGGAWMADALARCRRQVGAAGDELQLPVAHVVCNFSKPAAGMPALLNWDEVITLFHEFGHAAHHLLTEVEEYAVSGISGVEWDAVELPSQLLENFVWEWEVLRPMTAHSGAGEAMPKELFDKANAARVFNAGLFLMRQLEFALFDMILHSDSSAGKNGEKDGDEDGERIAAALEETRRETAVLKTPDYNRFYCGFTHIFAGGYAAGYYSYLWADVLAADAFMLFKSETPILSPALGARFRREVLAVGGSRPAMESFVAFQGRQPDIAALLARYGLAA